MNAPTAMSQADDLIERVRLAEELIRAQNTLAQVMYSCELESLWPKDASMLQSEYETRYGVNLDGEEYGG